MKQSASPNNHIGYESMETGLHATVKINPKTHAVKGGTCRGGDPLRQSLTPILVDTRVAAQLLSVSTKTIYRLESRRILVSAKVIGRKLWSVEQLRGLWEATK